LDYFGDKLIQNSGLKDFPVTKLLTNILSLNLKFNYFWAFI
jgi:hypothetical protein